MSCGSTTCMLECFTTLYFGSQQSCMFFDNGMKSYFNRSVYMYFLIPTTFYGLKFEPHSKFQHQKNKNKTILAINFNNIWCVTLWLNSLLWPPHLTLDITFWVAIKIHVRYEETPWNLLLSPNALGCHVLFI